MKMLYQEEEDDPSSSAAAEKIKRNIKEIKKRDLINLNPAVVVRAMDKYDGLVLNGRTMEYSVF